MTRHERIVLKPDTPLDKRLGGLPGSMRIAAALISRLRRGRIDITLPDGRTFRFEGPEPGPKAEIFANDMAFVRPVLAKGDIGFAESFMDGRFDTPDLADVLEYFTVNWERAGRLTVGGAFFKVVNSVRHALRGNTRKGSKRNILAHYDLGNAFYEQWLDNSMTYSSGIFEQSGSKLGEAQAAKYASIARNLDLKPGMRILEIGSGWGGFAEYAARNHGVSVDSITISDAQHDYAVSRIARAGLSDRVRILLSDYRDITGDYDGVASIEMFEAVGEKYWPVYFSKIAEVLRPGGKAALQIITIDDALFHSYRERADFIQTYIFPGGMLPSVGKLEEVAGQAGLDLQTDRMFGLDYARTLGLWAERFSAAWDDIRKLGFDERFRRLWLYYLAYCEAGFRTGRIDVGQFVATPR
ncbi:MAG: cyclopropane-fatty-acyl-phospholipid synthase family protein [Hyphomonadaceae bacterium]